jgi:hypothetical protein
MKVVGSFKDALSRQLSEAVRIDLRGGGVLNSKTEYSRCRVPRLVVDMEEWRKKKMEERKDLEAVTPPTDHDDLGLEMESSGREVAAPTYELKRKKQVGGPKGKRRKLEPLVDWGEVDGHDIWEDWLIKEGEMRNKVNWLISKEEPLPNMKLKQMEIDFKKVLDVDSMEEVTVEVEINTEKVTVEADNHTEIVTIVSQENAAEMNITSESVEQDERPPNPRAGSQYIRKTGRMTKKEKKEIASKNTKMTDWIRKGIKPVQPVQHVQEPDNGVEADMDWEVAPDVDRPWRRMIAQSKTAE